VVTVRVEPDGDGWSCDVIVEQAGQRTRHAVNVSPADLARWGDGIKARDVESLVSRSFDFLLEREPASSILAAFDLSVIQRYFPEYDRQFRRR
jgi:hypothetical protein